MDIKSFSGPSYPEVGEAARKWALSNLGADAGQWHNGPRGDGFRTQYHPAGYRIRAWMMPGSDVSGVLETYSVRLTESIASLFDAIIWARLLYKGEPAPGVLEQYYRDTNIREIIADDRKRHQSAS